MVWEDIMMENFLNDINNKLINESKLLQPVVLLERSPNILNNQSLSHEFYKKGQSSVSSHQSRPYSQSISGNGSMVSNQPTRFFPKNSFADRNQMLSQRRSQEQQTFQHPKLVNENQSFIHNQATRLNEMYHSTTPSQKIPEISDVSDRSKCYQTRQNFNDSTFNNNVNNQYVVNDHHFREPYVRDQSNIQSDLMDRFNQLQDSNPYILKAPYNIVQSTHTNQEIHAGNQARRGSNTQYIAESQQILEQSDVNNRSILYKTRPNMGVLDDHHFRRPYDVRGQFDVPSGLLNRFNRIQEVNQLSDPNVQYNIVGSTIADQFPQGSMLYRPVNMSMGSYFTAPKFTLQKMKEELSTAISVVDLIHSEMEIPINELEIHVITFLMKLKKQIQKVIANSPSSNASLASLNMSMENLQFIQQWLSSSTGLCGQSNFLSTYQQQLQTMPLKISNFNQPQQMTEMNRIQQSFAQQPQGNGQNELNELGESHFCELNHEDVDISLFNNSSKARLRDRSMLQPSVTTTTSTAITTQKQATKGIYKRMAKQVTTQQKPAPVADKNKLGKESLPIISSRGRIITRKINWEANKLDGRSTRKNINRAKRNMNSTASNLSSENLTALEGRKRKNNQNVTVPSKKRKQSDNNLTRNLSNDLFQSCDTSGSSFEPSPLRSNTSNISKEIPPRTRSCFSLQDTTKSPSFITVEEEHNDSVRSNDKNRKVKGHRKSY